MQLFQNSFSSKANVHDSFSNSAPDITFLIIMIILLFFLKEIAFLKECIWVQTTVTPRKKNPYEYFIRTQRIPVCSSKVDYS